MAFRLLLGVAATALCLADVPCHKGDPVGPSADLMHPAPICTPDSCANSTGVHMAQCNDGAECSGPLQAAFDSCCPTIIVPR